MDELNSTIQQPTEYNDDDIKTLDWMEHIRRRPGMYIGKLGDGESNLLWSEAGGRA